jgi:hypothetical protein
MFGGRIVHSLGPTPMSLPDSHLLPWGIILDYCGCAYAKRSESLASLFLRHTKAGKEKTHGDGKQVH